ncbi:hypothetical protein SCLCIDRAFT_1209129 [Scleroderma citrinum Foug A]|uniref:Ion transport domain-containing protein n=1 Tax=Scleroderma citrinum Foug A TaxID=1036808 RepID=A0A0C3A5E6_9AGAM|nr:hypothetical protein SCLCIDRAFT_1209129 [Scleroderma citrinum Foug A]
MDHESSFLLSIHPRKPASPENLTKLIRRLRALTLRLLPVEVDVKVINDPTNRIITPQVVSAYVNAAGDFYNELPYCLLRAHAEFIWDANHNPANYGENLGRATACEVLARRIIHQSSPDRMIPMMTTLYRCKEADGDISVASTALEVAIDNHCTIFLSSSESQDVVNWLWNGELVQTFDNEDNIQYVPYHEMRHGDFWTHLNPARMSVPRYQNYFRIIVWLFFLVVYSQAVREPLERLDPVHASLDGWEYVLYVMALAFWYKLFRFASYRAFGFWSVVAFITDALLLTAFSLRMSGLFATSSQAEYYRFKGFQVLSFVAPFIWMKLVTVFDGYKYIGTMQLCISRMLRESGIFFALLSVLGAGFLQGLYALEAADGTSEEAFKVINILVQGLLQSPDYGRFSSSPFGLTLFYFWNLVTGIILLNILISLFASAYSEIVTDVEAEYMSFFAEKTVLMIRAPDSYVYPAPFNLIEMVLVAPFEPFIHDSYAKLNRVVMNVVFFIPLAVIALYEVSFMDKSWLVSWLRSGLDEGEADDPVTRDPLVEGPDAERGLQISKVKFSELVKHFPNTQQSNETVILNEIQNLQGKLHILLDRIEKLQPSS